MTAIGTKREASKQWSRKDHNRLVALVRKHGPKWREIGERLGRSGSACQVRLFRHGPEELCRRLSQRNAPDLTPEQVKEAKRLRSYGKRGRMEIARIAKIMKVRPVQLHRIFMPHEIERKKYKPLVVANLGPERPIYVPPEVLIERDRAMSRPIDVPGEILGDPPPGRSALERMRAGLPV
jgi:hypothetical protein